MRRVEQPSDTTKRICTVCRAEKPLDGGFYQSKPGTPNYKTYGCEMPCKECNRARCRGKKRSDAQRVRDAERKRRPEVMAQTIARSAAWYATPKGKAWVRDYSAKRYAENGEAIRAANKARYHANPTQRERMAELQREKRATPEGRAAHNATNAAFKKTERGKLLGRMHRQLRRARLASTICTLTDKQWLALVEAYGGKCAYCGLLAPMTIDHIEPIARGGEHSLKNVVPACMRCNQVKNARPLREALDKLNVTRVDFLKRQGLALFALKQEK